MSNTLGTFVDWLSGPISGSSDHAISPAIVWHGRFMVVAWLGLIPISIIIARFYKVLPGQNWPKVLDNPFWFIWHRRLAYGALALTMLALAAALAARSGNSPSMSFHAVAGWFLVLSACAQVVSSLLRGTHGGPIDPFTRKARPREQWNGDHYCMTSRRVIFEYAHKIIGYVSVWLLLGAIASGLYSADAPRGLWILICLISLLFLAVFVSLQRQGRCLDTYQAIWGLDRSLPGNKRKRPIGWGIRRYTGR